MTPSLHFNGLCISLKCVHSRGGQINAVIGAKKQKNAIFLSHISSCDKVFVKWHTLRRCKTDRVDT